VGLDLNEACRSMTTATGASVVLPRPGPLTGRGAARGPGKRVKSIHAGVIASRRRDHLRKLSTRLVGSRQATRFF
jgi:hypothetical protein